MKLPQFLALLFLICSQTFAKESGSLDLYLLVGQSNMSGRGKLSEADRQPDPRVLVLNKENVWACQGEPIHFDKPKINGVGLGFTFAKLVADKNPGVMVGLIPCAVGGTPISRWKPGADLFEQAVARAKIAQQRGQLKGILWHQGESECGSETSAHKYGKDLAIVAEGFRRALNAPNVPFIAGELGEYRYTIRPLTRVVNEQIDSLPTLIPNAAAVSSAGLVDKGDNLHFSSESQKEFGHRYFKALQLLESKTSEAKKP